jgi:hypothetical protein
VFAAALQAVSDSRTAVGQKYMAVSGRYDKLKIVGADFLVVAR